jgi:DNA mismatch repair ATPase MutL
LVHVDDLKSIKSFGFRGEALASASMVGRVGIVSRVRPRNDGGKVVTNSSTVGVGPGEDNDVDDDDDDSPTHHNCAYKMSYKDGAPNPQTHPNSKPTPSAGREGTSITVQDLFYNIPSRRRAFEGGRCEREEYDKILDVVQRYAVHVAKRGVGFICRGGGSNGGGGAKSKKGGFGIGNRTDLNTQSLSSVKRLQEKRKMSWQNDSNPISSISEEEQFAATKDVIGHVFGSDVTRELLPLSAGEGDVDAVSLAALKAMVPSNGNEVSSSDEGNSLDHHTNTENGACASRSIESTNSLLEEMMIGANDDAHISKSKDLAKTDSQTPNTKTSKFAFAYRATGLVTNGSYSTPKSSSAFLLFINDRLVESTSIRRAVESVYCDTLPKGGKPFVYLSLELPGPHVDVNVHPTKREVAFLHEDRLCDAVSRAVRGVIGSATASRTFSVANGGRLLAREDSDRRGEGRNKLLQAKAQTDAGVAPSLDKDATSEKSMIGKENRASSSMNTEGVDDKSNEPKELSFDEKKSKNETPLKRAPAVDLIKDASSTKRPYDPSRLIRTNRSLPVGALEPFLVQTQSKSSGASSDAGESMNPVMDAISHKPGCPLANNPSGQHVDMSMPGAFALAICRCQVERAESLPPASDGFVVRNDSNATTVVRPKKITPTQCDYESIRILREEISYFNHQGLNESLRGSTYVGAVSRSRSLIQHGINLIMINHRELAREMFYQIALLKFKDMPMAELGGGGVDVAAAIGQMLQFEEDLPSAIDTTTASTIRVNKINADLARQATTCLAEKAPMLEEYFSIKFEKIKTDGNLQSPQAASPCITGLPILLDGHSPQPHALPLFLLRLATEVDWTEETPCFKGVCTELAAFYSELPFASSAVESNSITKDDKSDKFNDDLIDEEAKKCVKHTLFPAISFLLVPPKRLADNGSFVKLADLNSLYKVFERC